MLALTERRLHLAVDNKDTAEAARSTRIEFVGPRLCPRKSMWRALSHARFEQIKKESAQSDAGTQGFCMATAKANLKKDPSSLRVPHSVARSAHSG